MKKVVLIIAAAILLVACNRINVYNIKGQMGDNSWDGKQVTLIKQIDESGLLSVDSTIIKNGHFKLKGEVDTVGWYMLIIKNDNGQQIYKDFYMEEHLDFAYNNGKSRMTGSPVNDAYQAFNDKYDELTVNLVKLNAELKENPKNKEIEKAFNNEYIRFEKSFRALSVATIVKNLDNPLGVRLFQTTMSSMENKDIEAILAKAGPEFLSSPMVKMVVAQLAASKKVSIGCKYSDLTMSKPDGTVVSLSEYIGKGSYVMIDFWASWCSPCIEELPKILACYKKYHQKGFEIVGVSLDENATSWKAAIKNYHMSWPQMSDLASWKSQAVSVYSFSGIPYMVLIDPNGVIIANDLRGDVLNKKLAELLDK
jgi:peroxiredoxin